MISKAESRDDGRDFSCVREGSPRDFCLSNNPTRDLPSQPRCWENFNWQYSGDYKKVNSSPFFLLTIRERRGTLGAMESVVEFLLRSQNADGGWGYRVPGMSYIEPTAAVLLALKDADARTRSPSVSLRVNSAEGRARDFLLSLQHADGGWGIGALDAESGWMTAWAVRALVRFTDARAAVARGAKWLIDTEGLRVTDEPSRATIRKQLQIDSTLRGWPWQPGDAAWVHPTSLAILALCSASMANDARVRDGIAYLFDRAVVSGGWNIGNPEMLDKPVPATIQDTAVALLALHAAGESASEARIAKAIQYLREATERAQTAAELAWGVRALSESGIDVGSAPARLNALQDSTGSWRANPFITAIALKVEG